MRVDVFHARRLENWLAGWLALLRFGDSSLWARAVGDMADPDATHGHVLRSATKVLVEPTTRFFRVETGTRVQKAVPQLTLARQT